MSWAHSLLERMLAEASVRARAESARARALLEELTGKRLAIAVQGTPWHSSPFVLQSTGEALRLLRTTPEAGEAPDATISGAPLSLLALARDADAVIQRGDVHIGGDAQVAQRFRELIHLLAPDLEHELSGVLGRSTAHVLMSAVQTAAGAARSAAWTSLRNLAEYLAHEDGTLVPRAEAEHFLRGVEHVREQLDRLEVRIAQLERSAAGTGGAEPR